MCIVYSFLFQYFVKSSSNRWFNNNFFRVGVNRKSLHKSLMAAEIKLQNKCYQARIFNSSQAIIISKVRFSKGQKSPIHIVPQ